MQRFVALLLSWAVFVHEAGSCTTYVVGRKATSDGSVMSVHTSDGGGTTDPRLVHIPAATWAEGSKRPVWGSPEQYPRYVGTMRGDIPMYTKENCQASPEQCVDFVPLGFIPQVNSTYSYFEETYGSMNEKQVMIAESTCSGVFKSAPLSRGGKALFSIDELSHVAMERCDSAKCAVELMGELAEQYGFYGEGSSFEGGSESLIVSDPREAWVFHVLADPSGQSAIWVAARCPDDSVCVVANMFSVRVVDPDDKENFLGRSDMWDIAEEHNLWVPGMPLDFTATFSDGEYAHKYYSGRRYWGVLRLLSDEIFPAEYEDLKLQAPYPFAVKVSRPSEITPQKLMAINRDFYEGTVYSTGEGNLAGGPYGTPDRMGGQESGTLPAVAGNWERTITLYRTSCSYVTQARGFLPDSLGGVLWFGPHSASATVYVPLVASMPFTPDVLGYGWQGVYNLSSSFWAHRLLANAIQRDFSHMSVDLRALQNKLEQRGSELVAFEQFTLVQVEQGSTTTTTAAAAAGAGAGAAAPLTDKDLDEIHLSLRAHAEFVQQQAIQLFHTLNFKYADGMINQWVDGRFSASTIGYPGWWLQAVGYQNGPPPPPPPPPSLGKV